MRIGLVKSNLVLLDARGYWLRRTRRIANPAGCRGLSGRIRNPPGVSSPEILLSLNFCVIHARNSSLIRSFSVIRGELEGERYENL